MVKKVEDLGKLSSMKKCRGCDRTKNINCFGIDMYRKDGLHHMCLICRRRKRKRDRKENPKKYKQFDSNFYARKSYRYWWSAKTISEHRFKGINVQFNLHDLIQFSNQVKNCFYCGINLVWRKGRKTVHHNTPSLENVNLKRQITLGDILIVCHSCNTTKGKRTLSEFVSFCKTVTKLSKIKS